MRRLYGKEGDRLPPNPAFRHGLLHTTMYALIVWLLGIGL